MKRTILAVGRVLTEFGSYESYQLLITLSDGITCSDDSCLSARYDGYEERRVFYDAVSDAFAGRILKEGSPLEVGISNGLRIHPETGSQENILRLEDRFARQLSGIVCDKLRRSDATMIEAPSRN